MGNEVIAKQDLRFVLKAVHRVPLSSIVSGCVDNTNTDGGEQPQADKPTFIFLHQLQKSMTPERHEQCDNDEMQSASDDSGAILTVRRFIDAAPGARCQLALRTQRSFFFCGCAWQAR